MKLKIGQTYVLKQGIFIYRRGKDYKFITGENRIASPGSEIVFAETRDQNNYFTFKKPFEDYYVIIPTNALSQEVEAVQ